MDKWEYKIHAMRLSMSELEVDIYLYEDRLNEFGSEGWELVTSFNRWEKGLLVELVSTLKRRVQ
ncbi:DUF4177 domain-containing protein [Paenibacillus sp. N3.4]|uniref:DUF4177 domain-containing protein n=1 Tax=Paenibacillus sp. N3.4 TaxID=2603222 RepID=UPI0011CCDC6D|nr:DUF4177 domain-containing protein [Paenibacillus sp. N3.4]TXK80053.1 DUF4177 domain-containing protein [Paenibacillus sp. N3.4]